MSVATFNHIVEVSLYFLFSVLFLNLKWVIEVHRVVLGHWFDGYGWLIYSVSVMNYSDRSLNVQSDQVCYILYI